MKALKIMIIMLVLIMSVGAVCATDDIADNVISDDGQDDIYTADEGSFTDLASEIESGGTSLDLNQDYAFNNETENNTGITITKDNFVLNGNGHTIDGKNLSAIFLLNGNNITLCNLILTNANTDAGGAIYCKGTITSCIKKKKKTAIKKK